MSDTSGPTSRTPLAFYDPDTQCWRTSQATFLSDLIKSLETLPKSGMTQRGSLYELPTSALPTVASACSSLLPTPRAQNGEERNSKIWARDLSQPQNLENALALLPTPTSRDYKGRNQRNDATCSPGALDLLPTPTSSDYKGANLRTDHDGVAPASEHSLAIEASRLGETTSRPSDDGKPSWVEPPLFPPLTGSSTHDSLSG